MINVSLHPTCYTSKPEKRDIGSISNSIHLHPQLISIQDISIELSEKGRTIAPILSDKRSQKTWKAQRLLLIDFDEGNYSEVYEFIKKYNIFPSFSYHSFSSTPEKIKFRIVYDLGFEVDDRDNMKMILKFFKAIFGNLQPDTSCFELSRMFFGSNKGLIKELTTYNQVDWNQFFSVFLDISDKSTKQIKRDLEEISKYVQNRGTPIIYNIGNPLFWTYFKNILSHIQQDIPKARVNSSKSHDNNIKEIERDNDIFWDLCPAYRDILNGFEMSHDVKFRLTTNIIHFKNQREAFKQALIRLSPDWQRQYNHILKNRYIPSGCSSQCPYKCFKNLYKAATDEVIDLPDELEYISIEQAQNEIKSIIDSIISAPDKKIHVIYCQTGIGKTEIALDYDIPKFFPTHELKNEVLNRFIKKYPNKPYKISPELPKMSTYFSNLIKYYYKVGLWGQAEAILETISPEYLVKKKIPIKGNHFSTHAKLLQNPTIDDNTIIIDEDISSDLLSISQHNISDVITFLDKILEKPLREHIERLISFGYSKYTFTKESKSFKKWYASFCKKYEPKSNLKDLLYCKHLYLEGNTCFGGRLKRLPKNKTIIILSATPFRFLYETLYPESFVYHDIKPVKYKGKLIQSSYKSYSKSQLKKTQIDYDGLKEFCKNNDVTCITYKGKSKQVNDGKACYFGNLKGYDYLSGKSLLIFGTHKVPEQVVKLTAKILGIDFERDCKRQNIKIERNNKRLTYNTFKDINLQEIDLHYTEREMEQAVGRSRLVWNDIECFVLSNYPLQQSIIYTI